MAEEGVVNNRASADSLNGADCRTGKLSKTAARE
jgi:hypothetical protein